jgi:hypothetical protein
MPWQNGLDESEIKYDQTQTLHSEIGTTNCTKTTTKTYLLLKILLTPEGKCK